MTQTTGLTNLQLELIKIFKYPLPESQIFEIRSLLTRYFADKASDEFDRLWDENGWTNETMEEWANEHMRSKNG
jgi:hypothetical protein